MITNQRQCTELLIYSFCKECCTAK